MKRPLGSPQNTLTFFTSEVPPRAAAIAAAVFAGTARTSEPVSTQMPPAAKIAIKIFRIFVFLPC
jgi:hypothetical protein